MVSAESLKRAFSVGVLFLRGAIFAESVQQGWRGRQYTPSTYCGTCYQSIVVARAISGYVERTILKRYAPARVSTFKVNEQFCSRLCNAIFLFLLYFRFFFFFFYWGKTIRFFLNVDFSEIRLFLLFWIFSLFSLFSFIGEKRYYFFSKWISLKFDYYYFFFCIVFIIFPHWGKTMLYFLKRDFTKVLKQRNSRSRSTRLKWSCRNEFAE